MTETKTGSGTITKIDGTVPFLEYEYPFTDRQTGEKKTASCKFAIFENGAREKIKTTDMKVGDPVTCNFTYAGPDRVLIDFGPKKKSSGRYIPPGKSPEEVKTDRLIDCLQISERVYLSLYREENLSYSEVMDRIRDEAAKTDTWIQERCR